MTLDQKEIKEIKISLGLTSFFVIAIIFLLIIAKDLPESILAFDMFALTILSVNMMVSLRKLLDAKL